MRVWMPSGAPPVRPRLKFTRSSERRIGGGRGRIELLEPTNRNRNGGLSVKAIWNGVVLAESDDTVKVEGNHYFPEESLDRPYVEESDAHTVCPWKGGASYYSVLVDGERLDDAVWYYPDPSRAAEKVRRRVAFWRGVEVVPSEDEEWERRLRPGLLRYLLGR